MLSDWGIQRDDILNTAQTKGLESNDPEIDVSAMKDLIVYSPTMFY